MTPTLSGICAVESTLSGYAGNETEQSGRLCVDGSMEEWHRQDFSQSNKLNTSNRRPTAEDPAPPPGPRLATGTLRWLHAQFSVVPTVWSPSFTLSRILNAAESAMAEALRGLHPA
ncbi:hypothetical protein GN244_ATG05888 [Phytophthora infestans]|uniref:Uncharacterized protein n=1 Tax=Phytophthora infestans TaxID=4787 RepID=A0A833SWG5_PHYIN|nr:hypothetical protein GN244_ATG05888 [Phytophthora infestans]